MTRLCVVLEGHSENVFVRRVLAPHLDANHVWTTYTVVETSRGPKGEKRRGGGAWAKWLADIRRLCGDRQPDFRVTTMFDLYGLPVDFPGLEESARCTDTISRADQLENAMAAAVDDRRFMPNLMRHEFETLVLAAMDHLAPLLDGSQQKGLSDLRKDLRGMPPEDVDDGVETAPSKRLQNRIVGYRKLTHGVPATESAGLMALRAACPRFDAWVRRLEKLTSESPSPAN